MIETLKTFQEVVNSQTLSEVFNGTPVPDELQAVVLEWYFDRRVCDNDKFLRYFRRQVNLIYPEYERLLKVEAVDVNPLYTDYITRVKRNHGERNETATQTGSSNRTTTGNDSTTNESENNTSVAGSQNGTSRQDGTSTNTRNATTTTQGTTADRRSANEQADSQGLTSALPNTTSYTGFPDAMNWNSATAQTETKNNTTRTETDDITESGSEAVQDTQTGGTTNNTENTQTSQQSGSTKLTGTAETTRTGSDNVTVTNNNNVNSCESDFEDETMQGYKNFTAKNLQDFWGWVLASNAVKWFIDNLDVCFLGVFY